MSVITERVIAVTESLPVHHAINGRALHVAFMSTSHALSTRNARALRLALFTDTYTPQVNGVARTLERLVHAVEARGGVARVFTPDEPQAIPTFEVERFASVPFWAYPQLRLSWPARQRLRRTVRHFAPTLVHAATEFGMGLAGRSWAQRARVPLVSSYHTSFAAYASHYHMSWLAEPGWRYLRWFHSAALRTYCPTEAIVREVHAAGFRKTAVWSRGVDTSRFSPHYRSASLRQRILAGDGSPDGACTEDALVVSYVGRIAAEKGLAVALEALRLASTDRPGRIRFMGVGDGPYRDELHRRAPAGSWMPGALHGNALSEAFASADVFLFPSTTDTFGNVMLEAMASGLPVIGVEAGPTRELLASDRGWLVPPNEVQTLRQQLVALVDDRAAVAAARERALTFAATKTWDAVWDQLIGEYVELQGGSHTVTALLPNRRPTVLQGADVISR